MNGGGGLTVTSATPYITRAAVGNIHSICAMRKIEFLFALVTMRQSLKADRYNTVRLEECFPAVVGRQCRIPIFVWIIKVAELLYLDVEGN